MALSSFVKFLIKGKTTMIKEEITDQTLRAVPAVAGAVTTAITLNECAALITIFYVLVQTIILLHKHYYFVKEHKTFFKEEDEI